MMTALAAETQAVRPQAATSASPIFSFIMIITLQ
jgi:hypothetical protein